jgi:hypothetical protein
VNNSINFKIKFDVLKLEESSHKNHNHDDEDHIEQDRISRNKVRAKSMDMFNLGIKNASGTNISELFKQLKEQQNKEYAEGISFTS